MNVKVTLIALTALLTGCSTSERLAQQVQEDVVACQRVSLPQAQCMANLQEQRRQKAAIAAAIINSGPTYCQHYGNTTTCY